MAAKGKIYLAEVRGFCGGVRCALEKVEFELKNTPPPIYVLHEIVHNDYIVQTLREQGVIFVDRPEDVPRNSTIIFSAHGVSKKYEIMASKLGLKVVDATCPLVKKVHCKARTLQEDGYSIVLIGDKNHPEIVGTLGQLDKVAEVIESRADAESVELDLSMPKAYLTQTTLSVDEASEVIGILQSRFPDIQGGSDICYATQERQDAVKKLASKCDVMFIIGSMKSSNSNRLRDVAEQHGTKAYLVNSALEVTDEMLNGVSTVGVSAGASAPECLVEELVAFLQSRNFAVE